MTAIASKDGTILQVATLAEPQNPRAVMTLIHGFGEHGGRYQGMADVLAVAGIAVVAGDLRGHGASGGKRGFIRRYDDFAHDLEAILAETRSRFAGVPHILYGHSMGAGLVLHHMLQEPSAGHDLYGVIASAPLLSLPKPPPAILRGVVKLLRRIAPAAALPNPVDATLVSSLPAEQAAYLADPFNHGTLCAGLAASMVEAGEWTLSRAHKWGAASPLPLLLMHAREDQLTAFSASEDFAARASDCEFHAFDGVEHEMHNDKTRDAVYALMIDFITVQAARAE